MAKKKPSPKSKTPKAKSKSWARMTSSGFLHWVKRLQGQDCPISIRKLSATAESVTEAAQLSTAQSLLLGGSSPTLQKAFDSEVSKLQADFEKQFPDFEYSLGGPQRKE